uniref:Uncharacterized protein n=1 Tax=Romanomermis culicivorax TaxID=13658 RepID=A0A915KRZ5_ROMCU
MKLANQKRCFASYVYVYGNPLKWISEVTACRLTAPLVFMEDVKNACFSPKLKVMQGTCRHFGVPHVGAAVWASAMAALNHYGIGRFGVSYFSAEAMEIDSGTAHSNNAFEFLEADCRDGFDSDFPTRTDAGVF